MINPSSFTYLSSGSDDRAVLLGGRNSLRHRLDVLHSLSYSHETDVILAIAARVIVLRVVGRLVVVRAATLRVVVAVAALGDSGCTR